MTPPRLVPPDEDEPADVFAAIRARRPPRPPPVRELRRLDRAVHRPGRRRSRGPDDQDDALPDVGRLADRPRPDPGRRARQAGRRPRRDQGPLRRGGEHRLGPQARAGRRPRRVRARRAEDPLEGRPSSSAARAPGLRRYVHIGTGNYNPKTARLYTDLGLLSLPAGARRRRDGPVQRPDRPVPAARRSGGCSSRRTASGRGSSSSSTARSGTPAVGHEARIVVKLNAIVDEPSIDALYRASQAGVRVDIISRGGCSLLPGVKGVSEQHLGPLDRRRVPRALPDLAASPTAATADWYIGSADLMDRNLDRRVEAIVPVEDAEARARLQEIVEVMLADDRRSWQLGPGRGLAPDRGDPRACRARSTPTRS